MIPLRSWFLACAFVIGSLNAHAQSVSADTIVVAELRSLTLTRRDWDAERWHREQDLRQRRPDDPEAAIVTSNHCGEAVANFRAIRSTRETVPGLIVTFSIGEFCEPPISFSQDEWLLVFDGETGDLVARYPIFANDDDSLFAISEFGLLGLRNRPEGTQRLLTPMPLAEPREYSVRRTLAGDALRGYVERRPSLELRDGQVWLVSAIAVDRIFPGLTAEDLD